MNRNNHFRVPFFVIILSVIVLSCSSGTKKESTPASEENKSEVASILSTMITGLWSLDSGNMLTNEGFLLTPDGVANFMPSEENGMWLTPTTDSLIIKYNQNYEEITISYHIDSINEQKMILSLNEKQQIFRKVPFGVSETETVLSGITGNLSPGMKKSYEIDIPSGKKVRLKLIAKPEVTFSIIDRTNSLAENVQAWTGIIIRGGKYTVVITYTSTSKEPTEFDFKLISY